MKKIVPFVCLVYLSGCVNAMQHTAELHSTQQQSMTVGLVQKEIRKGMTQTDVAAVLGSPNIVTKDSSGFETWVYDKIASEASYSNSRGGVGLIPAVAATAGSALLLGIGSADYQKNAGASASTQKTLTVLVKFDRQSLVDVATYHASTF